MVGLSSLGEAATIVSLNNTYVSLHTADPGDTGVTEISGGAYARQGPASFGNAGNNPTVASNSSIITYPPATATWGTVTYFGLWSAPTFGNFLGSGLLTTPKTVNSGDTARFAQNALTITVQ